MHNVKDMRTPKLVREFMLIHVESAVDDRFDAARHHRLGEVVDELRYRGVLD